MKPPIPDGVYTEINFAAGFAQDIDCASAHIMIESAYITTDGVRRFERELAASIRRGVRVCCFVQKPHDYDFRAESYTQPGRRAELMKLEAAVEYLRELGAHVNLRPETHLKTAVFDCRVTWSGSLNILSYTRRTTEESLRWANRPWALDNIQRRSLDQCEYCLRPTVSQSRSSLDLAAIGELFARARKERGLSQRLLSLRIGVTRETISNIERGTVMPGQEVLIKLCDELNQSILLIPAEMAPFVETLVSPDK